MKHPCFANNIIANESKLTCTTYMFYPDNPK